MRLIDADALSAFVGDLRSTLHKEQSTFKAMTDIEFNTRDYMFLNFQYAIDNAPTVERPQGDLISREALKNDLMAFFPDKCLEGITAKTLFKQILADINNAPTEPQVTVFAENASKEEIEDFKQELENVLKRPKGNWILNKDENPECPFCHHSFTYWGNFCGNCGADMR